MLEEKRRARTRKDRRLDLRWAAIVAGALGAYAASVSAGQGVAITAAAAAAVGLHQLLE